MAVDESQLQAELRQLGNSQGGNGVTISSATAPSPVHIPHADAINHITNQLHNADEVPPIQGDKPGITAQIDG